MTRPSKPTLTILGALIGVFVITAATAPVHAHTAGFKAGKIIDDGVMINNTAMSASQIQHFLNSKVPHCDTNGQQLSEFGGPDLNGDGRVQRWEWGKSKYGESRFICLKDWKNASGKSAAQVIKAAADKWSINPKVLIVLLQKEQGLVTDTWPIRIQYRSATGYGCPDTAPCDTKYYGLENQLDWAARMYNSIITRNPNWYSPYVKGVNGRVYWHPSGGNYVNSSGADDSRPGCGYNSLNIVNWSTASLYSYTPYRPNQAALNAGYGLGDGCSSYGNRNFYSFFTDWFGTTQAQRYRAAYVTQSHSVDLSPGESAKVWIKYRNMGSSSWYDKTTAHAHNQGAIRLATTWPINRTSAFRDGSWLLPNRPTGVFRTVYDSNDKPYATNPHIVLPGESAVFEFNLRVPDGHPAGKYREAFTPVQDSGVWALPVNITPWFIVKVKSAPRAEYKGQSAYPPALKPGETARDNYFKFKNTGNTTWYDKTTATSTNRLVALSTINPHAHASQFAGDQWGAGDNRPSQQFAAVYRADGSKYSTNPHKVKPGETAEFRYSITAPDNAGAGTHREYIGLSEPDGVGNVPLSVLPWVDITTRSGTTARPTPNRLNEERPQTTDFTRTYTFKNTGTTTWTSANTVLRLTSGADSEIDAPGWIDSTTPARLNEASVAPGANGSFTVRYHLSSPIGTKNLKFEPFADGSSIALEPLKVALKTTAPNYKLKFVGQSAHPRLSPNSTKTMTFKMKNTGTVSWYDSVTAGQHDTHPVTLITTRHLARQSAFGANFARDANRLTNRFTKVYESDGATLAANQHVAQPGQIVEMEFVLTVDAKQKAGRYREYFMPIVDGSLYWKMGLLAWTDITVTNGPNRAAFAGQSAYPTISPGARQNAYLRFKNIGGSSWYDTTSTPSGIRPVVLSTSRPLGRTSELGGSFASPGVVAATTFAKVYESDGATLAANQHVAQPGQIVQFDFSFTAPSGLAPKLYREYFEPVVDNGSTPIPLGQLTWLDVTVR
ncbi:hypothetical protein CR983_02755 [Candidatus Saccharibacteria bacterium]|nr:MAG: hypothetical protein CR983_02755 [Candidatus Saccharibacteria bacterium]